MKINLLNLSAAILLSGMATAQININNLSISSPTKLTINKASSRASVVKQTEEAPQRKCATPVLNDEYETWVQKEITKQPQFANGKVASVVYTIPVIFHIIHSGQAVGSGRNISQAQINSQITVLNADFRKTNTDFGTWVTQSSFVTAAADCEINFCAAKVSPTGAILAEPGINRINTTTKGWTAPPYSGFNSTYIEGTIKPGSSWDPNKYLNIWIIEMFDGVLGYAQFPTVPSGTNPITDIVGMGGAASTDGVVFDYRYVGTVGSATAPYNKGRTAVHEIGHWLGLRHISGDANCGNDFVSDTPAQSDLSSSCPSTSGVVVSSGCGTSPNPPGRNYQNYMDYTEDKCLTMFTAGQKARMQACMANCTRRMSLNTSTVCTLPLGAGVEELNSNAEISIFPNPTNGELTISLDLSNAQDFSVSIINTLGQTIKEIKQQQSTGGIIKIDISNSSAGVYFVSFKSKNQTKTKRIVLQ